MQKDLYLDGWISALPGEADMQFDLPDGCDSAQVELKEKYEGTQLALGHTVRANNWGGYEVSIYWTNPTGERLGFDYTITPL